MRNSEFPMLTSVKFLWRMLGEINKKLYCKSDHRFLKKVFLPKRDKVTGGYGEQHSVERHDFYFSPNIIRVMK